MSTVMKMVILTDMIVPRKNKAIIMTMAGMKATMLDMKMAMTMLHINPSNLHLPTIITLTHKIITLTHILFHFMFLKLQFSRNYCHKKHFEQIKKCSPATTPMSKGEPTDGAPMNQQRKHRREGCIYYIASFGNCQHFHRKDVLLCPKIT